MLPIIALVGRPNVGKSTLFNRLTKSRDALVADLPGLTRDRHYGRGLGGDIPYIVIDTGGFEPLIEKGIQKEMAKQTLLAIDEADIIFFIVDGREGLTSHDHVIADLLRKMTRNIYLLVNKTEGMQRGVTTAEFFELGLGDPLGISSAHGEGVRDIIQIALTPFKKEDIDFDHKNQKNPKIAIVGRPNVGKSTLVNAFLGEDRMIAFDEPGTTRDSIQIDIERNEKSYTLIDTAGIRKKGKVFEAVEKFSVIKTLQAIEEANVSILVINAEDGITEQDAHVGAYILEAGRGLVIAINKWDRLKVEQREIVKQDILRKLHFLKFAEFQYISALKKKGLTEILKSVDEAYRGAFIKLATPKLTSVLIDTLQQHQPPISKGIRPKLRYAHQGGSNPPVIVIHGNHVNAIKHNYMRFLEESFRQAFQIVGTPLRIEFKQGENPFLAEEKRKPKEGVVSMRRRKNALRKKMTDKKRAAEKKL